MLGHSLGTVVVVVVGEGVDLSLSNVMRDEKKDLSFDVDVERAPDKDSRPRHPTHDHNDPTSAPSPYTKTYPI